MSDNYVHIIPAQPGFVPDEIRQQNAVSYFRSIAPGADQINASVSDHLEFVHCGGNFEEIRCPSCRTIIELDVWKGWMNHDYSQKGFILSHHAMPCCGARHTLHELAYEWPEGFARCDVCAMNPGIGKLSGRHERRFEEILGCPIRVIYEHI